MRPRKYLRVVTWLITLSLLVSACSGVLLGDNSHAQSRRSASARNPGDSSALALYTRELTLLARQGKLEITGEHEAEIQRAIQILSDNRENNPILTVESDLGATQVVEGLAARIASGDVPESLRQTRLYSLNLNALLKGVKTTIELESRMKAILAEAASEKNSILFVGEVQQFVGARAAQTVSDMLAGAASRGELHLVGATNAGAYENYIASDSTLDGLFQQIRLDDGFNATESRESSAKAGKHEDSDKDDNGFVGDKISADLREMIESAKADTDRLSVILQADDVRSSKLSSLLKRYGVSINERMAQLGALKAELPIKAIEEIAASNLTNHISPDRKLESFGHVTATTGTDLVRTQSADSILGLITTTNTLDGAGVGIAILDSGLDSGHRSFIPAGTTTSRIVYSKDFTGENRTDDPYGHGTHVAGMAAGYAPPSPGNSQGNGAQFPGIAIGASIINLRVLNSKGTGSTSAVLNALNWILSPVDSTKSVSSTNPLNKDK